MRRARGSGGRFLNTKSLSGDHGAAGGPPPRSANTSLSSEGPDNNGSKNSGNAGLTASEATSVYPAQDGMADFHAMGHLRSPSFFPSLTMDGGGEAKWVTSTPHGCCVDLLKV